ncbi:MAG TPA: hypothetical protein VGN23_12110 [Verrucomicrobiae bacterium]|jgi:hypothetical protein
MNTDKHGLPIVAELRGAFGLRRFIDAFLAYAKSGAKDAALHTLREWPHHFVLGSARTSRALRCRRSAFGASPKTSVFLILPSSLCLLPFS